MDARLATAYLLGHTTISLWVGHTGHELEVINSVVADFETLNPDLRVDVVGGIYDDKITAALRNGHGPNVVSSFESTNFGKYALTGGLVDLGPYLARDHVDDILNDATVAYTRYEGKQWALPMLADAYGLYFNKTLLAEANLSGPPRSVSELTEYAKKLTRRRSDGSLSIVGFNPLIGFYENSAGTLGQMFGARWINERGRAGFSRDPAWARMLMWQKDLVDWYGYDDLVKFMEEAGDEFSAANAFQTGRLAMSLDGEWRVAFIATGAPDLRYGTAPLPVDDARPELYGSGYINGTIIGIPSNASHKAEAWKLVKYLATDDRALVKLSNGLRNVPSTKNALRSPGLEADERFSVFLDIFDHPRSATTPIDAASEGCEAIVAALTAAWQSGELTDLATGLCDTDRRLEAQFKADAPPRARASAVAALPGVTSAA
jgi:multiple sugar transport system substrate-binding protein